MKSNMTVVITGLAWIAAGGMGRGRQAPVKTIASLFQDRRPLPSLSRKMVFKRPYRNFTRMDDYAKLGVSAVALTLKDAGWHRWSQKRNIGMIASTVYGCLAADIAYFTMISGAKPQEGAPSLFAYTLPNSFLGEAAIRFGLSGMNFVINDISVHGLAGIKMALQSMIASDVTKMLSGCCDLLCPPFLTAPPAFKPGALFFMLENEVESKLTPYGKLRLDRFGHLTFNGQQIDDLQTLAQNCLAALHRNIK
jgi:3-oxoacyl-[acyl-carrier-protein] synthase II